MEVLVDACLAEGAETLVYSMGISEEPCANWALQERIQGFLLDLLHMRGQVLDN